MAAISRTQAPPPKNNWRDYKPFLRIDFAYRCAYCRLHEAFGGTQRNFIVEHFRPRKFFPELTLEYSNLYYACTRCNDYKGSHWPSNELVTAGFYFGDPCVEDIYSRHFEENRDGVLNARTNCGEYTITHLQLNRDSLSACRRRKRILLDKLRRTYQLVRRARKEGRIQDAVMSELIDDIALLRSFFRPSPPES